MIPSDLQCPMLLLACLFAVLQLSMLTAQSPNELSARLLDSLLQDYAFRAFFRPRTGVSYDGIVPSNLTGIRISAMRLRSGSLRKRGTGSYKEFQIPAGMVEQPYVNRLVLVYHNLGNWSSLYYPLPGYVSLAPVLGLLAYDASNLSATDLPELNLRATESPILVKFPNVELAAGSGPSPKCVYFGLQGSVEFDNVVDGSACSTVRQGHFSIVVEGIAPSPAPDGESGGGAAGGGGVWKREVWIVVGSVVGGLVLVAVLVVMVVWVKKCRGRKKIGRMEEVAGGGVPLATVIIASGKLPVAMGTRTRPVLESEYLP
ncbi:hypothetical protein RJ640_025248 [Escallonia rubra]|uniref:Uncharacterized protein n=1 Tax=Escallonia rubra TaxID=112253 RepID=A0AA88URG9_9ASTE|nr:hypothetical protein RJ640_025248 [Escallonia rubra]